VIDPDDLDLLQDMVLAAVNERFARPRSSWLPSWGGLTAGVGDLGLPGL
jgi:nucleoid-associated protein EbfC